MKPLAEDSKAKIIAVYDGAAATYNRVGPSFFLHFGKRLASGAGILPDSTVLDLATGTGAVLVPAAELVGPEGRVVGIDISLRMICRAWTEIRDVGLDHAHALVADAERLPFPRNSFDCVLCSFAIFLFSNLSSLFSECHRVLRSSGRIGLAYSAGEDREWTWYEQLISKYGPTAGLGTERYSPQDVETALNDGGFKNVSTSMEAHRLIFSSASEFWNWAWSHGDRAVLESLTGSRSEFKRELFDEFRVRAGTDGLPYQVFAAVTLANKAG
jgi:ubiquinone/menaquinone biosynthesis C-methylase UbiE